MTHMQYVYSCRSPDGRTVEVRVDTDLLDPRHAASCMASSRIGCRVADVLVKYVSTRSRGFEVEYKGRFIERNRRRLEAA